MPQEHLKRVSELFHRARELPPNHRRALLDAECGAAPDIRAEVEELLAQDDPEATLEDWREKVDRIVGPARTPATPDEMIGRSIGQYRIKRVIASGGMGTVYEAVQEQPRRVVALKAMKSGIASKSALRRFEYESQILARLRHQNIAQVHEAGTHREGESTAPFFAMEYIPNARPITDYAKAKKLATKERLQLFAQVCAAVHHGHQKGIIHRDLKPGNILVDSHGQVKIIDFGVARATDSDLAITTLQTDVGQLIGTLQYMSPEQCEADPHDLDVRSDVYALGVVLYELICEQLPYDVREAAIYEAARIIREQAPTKPSTIARTLRGDIETITLKALEKERARRYQSAEDLRRDIDNYLRGEAISARPPSLLYQLRVFSHRNKAAFTAIAAVFVILTAATIFSSIQYFKADAARADAVEGRTEAKRKAQEAEDARGEAETRRVAEERERKKAESIKRFLQDMLSSINPNADEPRRSDLTVREVLDQAYERLKTEFQEEPEVRVHLLLTIGHTYLGLGLRHRAEEILRSALEFQRQSTEEDTLDTAAILLALADVISDSRSADSYERDFDAALSLCREAQAIYENLLGPMHKFVAHCKFKEATILFAKDAKRTWILSIDDQSISTRTTLFATIQMLKVIDPAEFPDEEAALVRKVLKLWDQGEKDKAFETLWRFRADVVEQLSVLWQAGRRDDARQIVRSHFRPMMRNPLFRHGTVTLMVNLARGLSSSGAPVDAVEPYYHEAVQVAGEIHGAHSMQRFEALTQLSRFLRYRGDNHSDAIISAREAVELGRSLMSDDNPNLHPAIAGLGASLVRRGSELMKEDKLDEAIPLLRECLGLPMAALPVHRWPRSMGRKVLGKALAKQRKFNEAESLLIEGYHQLEEELESIPAQERETSIANAIEPIVTLYSAWHDAEPDRGYDVKAFEWRAKIPPARRAMSLIQRSETLLREQKAIEAISLLREAEPLLLDSYADLEGTSGAIPASSRETLINEALHRIIELYDVWHDAEPGSGHDRKAADWRRKLPPDERADSLMSRSFELISDQLAVEAIPLLREVESLLLGCYADLEGKSGATHATRRDTLINDTVHRLIDLYHYWHEAEPQSGYDRKASEWGKKLSPEDRADSLISRGRRLINRQKAGEAIPLLRECLTIGQEALGDDSWRHFEGMSVLGQALTAAGEFAEAETLLLKTYQDLGGISQAVPASKRETLVVIALHGLIYLYDAWHAAEPQGGYDRKASEWGKKLSPEDRADSLISRGRRLMNRQKAGEAIPLLRECVTIGQEALGDGDWLISNAMSVLGEALTAQGEFADAEPLLLDSYEQILQAREAISGGSLVTPMNEARVRIVKLYEAWHAAEPNKGYDAKAAEWREKLEALQASTQPATSASD